MRKRRRYTPYTYPRWLKNIRGVCTQFAIPFCVFQTIRTLLFPTSFDVLFLAVLILIAVALHLQII